MKLKDLFKSTKIIQSSSLEDMAREIESQEYIESFTKDKQRFLPNVDYSKPANFAYFGSAEKYYTDSFVRIRNTYPYDGSEREKFDWLNESTFIDLYIFDNRYPRFNGFVNLGYPSWGTLSGSLIDGYGKSDSDVYIKTFGGPHKSDLKTLKKQHEDANKYDTSKTRESNLKFKLEDGVTIEMWLKKPAFNTAKTEKEVLFDLWNGEASSSAQYGRLRLELTGASSGSPFLLTALSGTTGKQNQIIGQNITTASITDWTHVALTMKNSTTVATAVDTNLYINGALNRTQTISGMALKEVTGSMISYLGALQTAPSGSPTIQSGAGKFSGSIDEFRYWKTERTSKEIGRHYWTNIGGGTNTDQANTNLGVYYKFNEGITGTSSFDSVVLDYSGRVSNGTWTGYQAGARSTDSAIVLSKASKTEFKDPTIYSSHPTYKLVLDELEKSGSVHDTRNNSALFHTMPAWITEEDDTKHGNLKNLTQIMGSYFDNLYLHIQEINSLKDVYSHFQANVIDQQDLYASTSITGTVKPLPFADRLLTNAGFVAPELFADATVLEALATRSEDENYEMKLHNVKNQIYQNVYSCISNIYKQKGTNKSFRNVLHSFGVDEDVVKINFYGDNVDFEIEDRHKIRSSKEKFVSFSHPDRFHGTVYQYASGSSSSGFISGSGKDFEKYIPVTFEVQTVLPDKMPFNEPNGFATPFVTSSIVGIHEANASTPSSYTIPGTDSCGLDIYTVRDEQESKRVRFHLSSSALGVHLSSSLYDEQYKNNQWLLAFKIRNDKAPSADLVLSSSLNSSYLLEFVGYNTVDKSQIHTFSLTASVASASAHSFLNSSKRIYAGAQRQNFTGSTMQQFSDHNIGFVRYWMSYLEDETLQAHAYDSKNYGAGSPFRSSYLMEDSINDIKIPEIETLLLSWDFETLSTTDSSGQFIVLDTTSGSAEARYSPTFQSLKSKFYHGRGDKFLPNDEKVIDANHISIARVTYPEILQGDDMIEIRLQDDVKFTKNTLPQDYYIAFEKSMAQTVSEEMIRYMASVKDFNNLIGRPVNRYRMEYKDLSKLRQLFFEKIRNEPDLDKYIDYYKWLDDALGEMLVALVPASLKHSDGINNVIENYIFARDKYFNKFPTIEFKAPTPEGGMNTINRHLYPWKTGHAPVGGSPENENCFWWLNRAERDRPILSGSNSGSNHSRVKVFQNRKSVLDRSFTTAQHFAVDRGRSLHGGVNYEDNKKRDYVWSATKEVAEYPLQYNLFGGFPLRYIYTNNEMLMALKDCTDERPAHEKIKRAFFAIDGMESFRHAYLSSSRDGVFKGGMVMPFNIMSSSVTTGYAAQLSGSGNIGGIDLANVHSDTTDNTNAIPLQGPFTERWVGGHQSRHAPVNRGSDGEASRGEGYKILVSDLLNESGALGVVGADYPAPYSNMVDAPHFRVDQAKARYYRDGRAKRPLNIKNIKTSGSQVGNYQKNYQFVHTFGRAQQRLWMREQSVTIQRHNAINKTMPTTTQETGLFARGTGSAGNTMSNFHSSSLYLGGINTSTNETVNTATDSVLATKFSAPGSYETMSDIFLDLYGREKSVYNALPFRNLTVRGSGSGESGTFRLIDIHGNRYGLRTHLTRHSARFGIDSVVGSGKPSFHKVNRNAKWDASEESYDYDNYWHQHHIPQSDFQYKWVKLSHTATLATSSMAGHLLSDFSEPSGTTARYPHEHISYAVPSQSVVNRRRDTMTAYGYPSWEQVRNNDTPENNKLKKSYGYNIFNRITLPANAAHPHPSGNFLDITGSREESRVTANIPNKVDLAYKKSRFEFIYPYVNMRYHFSNQYFHYLNVNPNANETMYETFYSYYSNNANRTEDNTGFSVIRHKIRQNVFPQYIKHTKFNVRHRHFYTSHFWADGENKLYNTDTSETGSYHRLDEIGRRQTNVTASLFKTENLNTITKLNISAAPPVMTNIIPSQSIWSMDSRTNFTSSSPQIGASNSAGAPGVLQNQDHHFHNNTSKAVLLQSGSAASGSFQMSGATVPGTKATGSFTVRGIIPVGNKATGSFQVTSSNVQGTSGQVIFQAQPANVAAVSASYQFRVKGREIPGQFAKARFEVSGAFFTGSASSGSFVFDKDIPLGGRRSYVIARISTNTSRQGDLLKLNRRFESDHSFLFNPQGFTDFPANTSSLMPTNPRRSICLSGSEFIGVTLPTTGPGSGLSGVGTNKIQPRIFSMYTKITNSSLLHATNKKYLVYLYDAVNGNPVLELYYNSGSGGGNPTSYDLVMREYRLSGSSLGFTQLTWAGVGGSTSWRNFTIFTDPSSITGGGQIGHTALYIDGTKFGTAPTLDTSGMAGMGSATSMVYNEPTTMYIAGAPNSLISGDHRWTAEICIDSFVQWGSSSYHPDIVATQGTKQLNFVTAIYNGGTLEPHYSNTGSAHITQYYDFGQGRKGTSTSLAFCDDIKWPGRFFNLDPSSSPIGLNNAKISTGSLFNHIVVGDGLDPQHSTAAWVGTSGSNIHNKKARFRTGKFVDPKTEQDWRDHIVATISSVQSNDTFFDIEARVQEETASSNMSTTWYKRTSGSFAADPLATYTSGNGGISTGDTIGSVLLYVVSKQQSIGNDYQLDTCFGVNAQSGQLRSVLALSSSTTSNAPVQDGTVIHDTGISIGGTSIFLDHHSSSQTPANCVRTWTTLNKSFAMSSTSGFRLKNDYPVNGLLNNMQDSTMSWWYAKDGDNTGSGHMAFAIQFDAACNPSAGQGGYHFFYGGSAINIKVFASNTVHRRVQVTYANIAAQGGQLANFNVDDFNHYAILFDASTFDDNNGTAGFKLYVNGVEYTGTYSYSSTGTSFGGRGQNLLSLALMNGITHNNYRMYGRFTQFAAHRTLLTAAQVRELYSGGRHDEVQPVDPKNLAHYYPLNNIQDGVNAASVNDTLTTAGIAHVLDKTLNSARSACNLTVNGANGIRLRNGIPSNNRSTTVIKNALEETISNVVTNFTASRSGDRFTIISTTANSSFDGTAINNTADNFYTGASETSGGLDSSGSVQGHNLAIGSKTFIADGLGTSNTATNFYIANNSTDSDFWDDLSQSIKDNTVFDTINITGTGNKRFFNLTASTTGTANNGGFSVDTGNSFRVLQDAQGGTNHAGILDDDRIQLKPSTNSSLYRTFRADFGGSDSDTATIKFVHSSQSSDVNFWNALKTKIEAEGFGVAYNANSPSGGVATFTITNHIGGAAGNSPNNNIIDTPSFDHHTATTKFAGGSDTDGAQPGDTITINGVTITLVNSAPGNNQEVKVTGVSDTTFWNSLSSSLSHSIAPTYNVVKAGSGSPRTFTVTSVATGTAQNPNASEGGSSFTIDSQNVGTAESGAENGDEIIIGGSTFAINLGSGLGTGSTSDFHNALKDQIIAATNFDTITITALGTGYSAFRLTSSVTGTAENVDFETNSAGSRNTFNNTQGAGGGTNAFGIGHRDHIIFKDTEDSQAGTANVRFLADTTGTGSFAGNYTKAININTGGVGSGDDPNPLTGSTDEEKSNEWWNKLSASIKANTGFDEITITKADNVAVFHLTASLTGSNFNNDIVSIHLAPTTPPAGHGFEAFSQTKGGTNETGAKVGNTITLGDGTQGGFVNFSIVSSSSPGPREINAADTTDSAMFDALSASIKANTPYGSIIINSSSIPATFHLTSSRTSGVDPYTGLPDITGSNNNFAVGIGGSNRTFRNAVGVQGGTDGLFKFVKFTEVIPQPRYAYPHILTSPGSVRAPSAKSNLGLITPDYKLRSNHFNLTRSLGKSTDGLYDNTSRWITPDLTGLTPFDSDYNTWYEDIKAHNKHFALVPEFRISSHVPSIVASGTDLFDYFSRNYWMELTGTSFDDGKSVATNRRPNQNKFVGEYAITTNIKNVDTIVEDNNSNNVFPYKITLTCEALKKFLPYEGFYPQTRTVQMCEAFANSYGKHFRAQEADPSNTNLEFPINNVPAQSRPIYDAIMSPGILYNTIKSGMAVDYPVLLNRLITGSYLDPYGGTNYMIRNEYFNERLPFETLISPEAHLYKKSIVDANPHPSSSFNLKTRWTGQGDINYKLMANNFFAETIEFFLQGGKTSRIISKPDTDPSFGIVLQDHAGRLPVYRAMFRVYKSKKAHPYLELSGTTDIISGSDSAFDKFHNRPPSGTNYFLKEYGQRTGSALEYDIQKVNFPRPQFNPYVEVETMTMYSQPNAFGPPCAGGVAVQLKDFGGGGGAARGGTNNNTTYMMYDSTNGYNSPFTPPYYDGEAWAIYTFAPIRSGKHTLDEIIENTTVKYLRYELNHESGSFGDRGTAGPQGFAINDNAMQANASFDLFKQISIAPAVFDIAGETQAVDKDPRKEGKAWVIQSKFETPILDFSKYLNREYNAEFESDVTSADIYTASLSLSGASQEKDNLSSVHASLASVSKLSGALNPIGMWHQYGEFPENEDKGIFMQLVDVPPSYVELGTEMTIANPKYTLIQPNDPSCDASGMGQVYATASIVSEVLPYFKKTEIRRRLEGVDEFSAVGGAIQVLNADTGIILDTELREADLQAAFGTLPTANSGNMIGNFSVFNVFRDSTNYTMNILTGSTFSSGKFKVFSAGSDVSNDYSRATTGDFPGHFAASYYHFDRPTTYAPLLIATKNLNSLKYDFGEFRNGFFEDFLKDFSIGIHYSDQSPTFGDSEPMKCASGSQGLVFVPKLLIHTLELKNNNLTLGTLSELKADDTITKELLGVNTIITNNNKTKKSFKSLKKVISMPPAGLKKPKSVGDFQVGGFTGVTKKFDLIPPRPAVQTQPSTASYTQFEPMFVRAAIRFNQGAPTQSANQLYNTDNFASMSQYAPQNENNIAGNASTVRWGQYMHTEGVHQLTKSLADLVGFSQQKVKMGVTAEARIIREAVVAIPYVQEGGVRNYLNLNKPAVDKYLFAKGYTRFDRTTERGQKMDPPVGADVIDDIETALGGDTSPDSFSDPRDLVHSSVKRQISKMRQYSLPPHLDFVKFNINPVAMYFFEFKKELNRQELNDLWQGVRSKSLTSVKFDTKSVTHILRPEALLGSLNGQGVGRNVYADADKLKNLKWLVFKVKEKANTSYTKKMESDLGDPRFKFDLQNSEQEEVNYGYNWPYDYFSLVENAKLSVEIDMRYIPDTTPGKEFTPPNPDDYDDDIEQQYDGIIEDPVAPLEDSETPYKGYQVESVEDDTPTGTLLASGMEYGTVNDLYGDPEDDTGGGGGTGGGTTVGFRSLVDIEIDDPASITPSVQGSGGGAGYGGSGGGGVGQGSDGVDDDY